jgi:predicted acetyltransferase
MGETYMGEIRKLSVDSFHDIIQLSQYAFQYNLSEEEIEKRKQLLSEHEIWAVIEDEKLAAKLHIIPFSVFIHNLEVSMGGIAGVATWPEFRRKGHIHHLITHSLQQMKSQDQIVSFLHPFDFEFYRKYGWELFASFKKYEIKKQDLFFYPSVSGRILRMDKEIAIPILSAIYEEFAERYNGMLKRSPEWWSQSVISNDDHVVAYLNENGKFSGYFIYHIKNRLMEIEEWIYTNEEARRALWNFICQHDSMIDLVTIKAPIDDQLPFLMKNPRIKQEIVPYFMARIVHVEKFLNQYPFSNRKDFSIFLHIYDQHAPWNSGSFQITEDNIRVFQKQKKACSHPPKRGLYCDITVASAMFLGYERPSFFYKTGQLKGNENDVEILESLIPDKKTYFPDFF